MLKPNLLREMLVKFAPQFEIDPNNLEVYVTRGVVKSTGVPKVGWSTEYDIEVFAVDFDGELDHLILAILLWMQQHQPELLANPEKRQTALRFDADILNDNKIDVLFTIKAEERTYPEMAEGKITFVTPLNPREPKIMLPEWEALIEDGVIAYG